MKWDIFHNTITELKKSKIYFDRRTNPFISPVVSTIETDIHSQYAAYPNILRVDGDAVINGNLRVSGDITSSNSDTLRTTIRELVREAMRELKQQTPQT